MKVKNYEQTSLLFIGIFVIIFIELIFFFFLFHKKEFIYHSLTGIVLKKDYVVVMVNQKEKEIIYQNENLFFKNQKKAYEIIENHGKLMTRNKKDYYELVLKFKFSNTYKESDILELVLPQQKYRRIEIIKKIIGGR